MMAPLNPNTEPIAPGAFRRQLRHLLANRGSPEAAAMFQTLMKYIHKRVVIISRRCGGRLTPVRREEIVADVLLQLMEGSLARFRGDSLPELLGFVRVIADRCTWRVVQKTERERRALSGVGSEDIRDWNHKPAAPDQHLEVVGETPLSEGDQEYLKSLLRAGSKAEFARMAGVSRAAVTQRVQRIRARIEALATPERMAHEAWINQAARSVIEGGILARQA
jgi:DNA-directed RNA polymerase specialized sigma24 family protein